ncbi:transcription initiation factor TFIID subunit 7 [Acrasis kona]|uniref:Transcription initiation factor TFIID subunit 7 n=1 Tax=Acrasis kona TaxID=1008807 RepID=A0AAW2YPC4_9EUKA
MDNNAIISNSIPTGTPPTHSSGSKKKSSRSSKSNGQKPPSKKSSSKVTIPASAVTFQTPTQPSSSKSRRKKDTSDYDQTFEEKQFILRVPTYLAERIHDIIKEPEQKKSKKDDGKEKRVDLDMDLVFGDHPDILEFFKAGVRPKLPEEPAPVPPPTDKKMKKQLRLERAEKLRKLMDESGYLTDVEYGLNENRAGRFRLKDQTYPCLLVDLPTLVEAYKSVDCMTYYKAGDVSQMILVKDPLEMDKEIHHMQDEKMERIKKEDEKARRRNKKKRKKKKRFQSLPRMFQLEDGLTPSMAGVLKHFERQRLNITKKDIEKMVDEFNKMMEDEDPENIQIEVIEEDIKEDDSSSDDESSSDEEDEEDDEDANNHDSADSDFEQDQLMAAMNEVTPSPMYSPSVAHTPIASAPYSASQRVNMNNINNSIMSDQSLSEMSSGEDDDDAQSLDGNNNANNTSSNSIGFLNNSQQLTDQSMNSDEDHHILLRSWKTPAQCVDAQHL